MAAQTTPPVTIAKSQGGVLPISAVTDKHNAGRAGPQRAQPQQKTKVVLRRLPPGITRAEIETALGDDWKPGAGKVAWAEFKPGKVSKDVAKPSRPARIYIQVADPVHLEHLQQTVAQASFVDARNTASDTVLIGPPALEFAPYGRIPSSKRRSDARQGTIDQDPEFIEFLESLTNPITKPKALEASATAKDEPVTTTPLIQHLREKKANKEKVASAKSGKKHDAKEAASDAKADRKRGKDVAKSNDDRRASKGAGTGKDSKDGTKGASVKDKASTTRQTATSATPAAGANGAHPATSSAPSTPSKRPESAGPGSAAARLIQRDLGLRGSRGGGRTARGGRNGAGVTNDDHAGSPAPSGSGETIPVAPPSPKPAAKDPSSTATSGRSGAASTPRRAASTKPSTSQSTTSSANANTPSLSAPKSTQPNPSKRAPTSTSSAPNPTPSPQVPSVTTNPNSTPSTTTLPDASATRAFIKNAHTTSGVTEALLRTALSEFGPLTSLEHDRRRGFAFATFAAPGALRAAVAAGGLRVGDATVHVAERRERGGAAPPAGNASTGAAAAGGGKDKEGTGGTARTARGAGGARGGRRGGRGRGGAESASNGNAGGGAGAGAVTTGSTGGGGAGGAAGSGAVGSAAGSGAGAAAAAPAAAGPATGEGA